MNQLESLAATARWDKVKAEAQTAIRSDMLTDAEKSVAQTYLALAHVQQGEPGPALDAADKAVQLDESNGRSWLMRGTAYMMLRQLDAAEKDFSKALQKSPGMWEACRNLAELAQARGDFPTALDWFGKATALAPKNIDLGMEYALLLHSLGLHAKADDAITNVIVVAQDTPALFNNRGMIRLALDRYEEALSDFSRAIAIDPAFEEALVNRGNVLRAFKRYDESLADFASGIALHPKSVKLLVGRAYTLSAMSQYHAAAADMAAAYSQGNVDPYILNEYAWFLATCPDAGVRDGARAVKMAKEAIELSAGPIPGYFDTLAAAFAESGEYIKAVEAQRQAIFIGQQAGLPRAQLEEWASRLEGYSQGVPYRNNLP
ncbi:tetratricopeptide repeat protein [Desulfovibrio mangrovi]|uniref:tetratricopeptide repeat protein n=1 Tax=Desulfovibrio mangrovi TaxID=2976983 RepID=UPI00224638C6|nr:tetratricopeptide repeat protein [Desulfovibrio mangrovi]UZP68010.1 tetratricopeptide repeat protein [Desulfovibrio mangrovi]